MRHYNSPTPYYAWGAFPGLALLRVRDFGVAGDYSTPGGFATRLYGGFCHAPPRPQRATSPRATFPHPHPLDSGLRRDVQLVGGSGDEALQKSAERLVERFIPDRVVGNALLRMAWRGFPTAW